MESILPSFSMACRTLALITLERNHRQLLSYLQKIHTHKCTRQDAKSPENMVETANGRGPAYLALSTCNLQPREPRVNWQSNVVSNLSIDHSMGGLFFFQKKKKT